MAARLLLKNNWLFYICLFLVPELVGLSFAKADVQVVSSFSEGAPSCEVLSWRLYYRSRYDQQFGALLDKALQQGSLTAVEQKGLQDTIAKMDPTLSQWKEFTVHVQILWKDLAWTAPSDPSSIDLIIPGLIWHSPIGQVPEGVKLKKASQSIELDIDMEEIDFCFGTMPTTVSMSFANGNKLSFTGALR